MQKYKLIKWYPGLRDHLQVGDTVEFRGTNEIIIGHYNGYEVLLPLEEVQNNPDYWEKVEENFRILELICKDMDSGHHDKILEPKSNGLWQWRENNLPGNCTLKSLLNCGNDYRINKVKRLYDGRVFELGDTITHKKYKLTNREIGKFKELKTGNLKIEGEGFSYLLKSVEKVKQKTYRILKQETPSGTIITYDKHGNPIDRDDWIGIDMTINLEKSLEIGKCSIHAVERLSDGEVFTVGDQVAWDWVTYSKGDYFTIGRLFIEDGVLMFHSKENKCDYGLISLSKTHNLRHAKVEEPIFTTEDGVDIYEGDKYWFCRESGTYVYADHATEKSGNSDNLKYFSSKEKAKEWAEDNKPRYSRRDIEQAIADSYSRDGAFFEQILRQKLNL